MIETGVASTACNGVAVAETSAPDTVYMGM